MHVLFTIKKHIAVLHFFFFLKSLIAIYIFDCIKIFDMKCIPTSKTHKETKSILLDTVGGIVSF